MKKNIVFLFAIQLLILYSCRSHCDGFPDRYLKWIPYQMNDKIKYVNNHDTIILSVIDYFKTEPFSPRTVLPFVVCDPSQGYYQTTNDHGYSIREEFEEGYNRMQILITDKEKFTFNILNKSSYSDSIKVKYSADTTINLADYQEVFLISKDTISKSPQIAWIIKAKDKGIVEFYNYRTKQKWDLVAD